MKLIDLSLPLENGPSEREGVDIRYFDHRAGAEHMSALFEIPVSDLPDQKGWAGELITAITHTATHMDAPFHYGPLSENKPARTIDEVPLDWCVGNGMVLDMTGKSDGDIICVEDVRHALKLLDTMPGDDTIVLIRTGADAHWGSSDYPDRGAGLDRESTKFLVECGVRVIGIDAWGFDRPFKAMREAYAASKDPAVIWPAHFYGREREYLQLEKLTNLDRLPRVGFRVYCFPIKIKRASAAWCRVVAEVPG
jgi:kynurenine formamidase